VGLAQALVAGGDATEQDLSEAERAIREVEGLATGADPPEFREVVEQIKKRITMLRMQGGGLSPGELRRLRRRPRS